MYPIHIIYISIRVRIRVILYYFAELAAGPIPTSLILHSQFKTSYNLSQRLCLLGIQTLLHTRG